MSKMEPSELARKIGEGLLSFPVTHFTNKFQFDETPYREHISWLLDHEPAGLFAAGGTGEFFSLTLSEFSSVVHAAVLETAARVPVLAGCGYGTAMAIEFARAAEDAGADGILLLPPYLVNWRRLVSPRTPKPSALRQISASFSTTAITPSSTTSH